MAERHVRAIHAHSKATGRTYKVIKEIALDMGRNNEPSTSSIRKLAWRCRFGLDSVRQGIIWGVENGEIKEVNGGVIITFVAHDDIVKGCGDFIESNENYYSRYKNAKGKITKQTRKDVISSFGGCCWYCGGKATDVEHATPLSRGGNNLRRNLLPSCSYCNSRKRGKTVDEFRRYLNTDVFWGEL